MDFLSIDKSVLILTPLFLYPSRAIFAHILLAIASLLLEVLYIRHSVPVLFPFPNLSFAPLLKCILISKSTALTLDFATILFITSDTLVPLLQVQSYTICPSASKIVFNSFITFLFSVDSSSKPTAPQATLFAGLCPACMLIFFIYQSFLIINLI